MRPLQQQHARMVNVMRLSQHTVAELGYNRLPSFLLAH
jgi:hypothetical protein